MFLLDPGTHAGVQQNTGTGGPKTLMQIVAMAQRSAAEFEIVNAVDARLTLRQSSD